LGPICNIRQVKEIIRLQKKLRLFVTWLHKGPTSNSECPTTATDATHSVSKATPPQSGIIAEETLNASS
jgi:hypothetical protein